MNENELSYYWKVSLSGMTRFFDEGHTIWSRKNFYGIHGEEFAESDYVQNKLKELEGTGAIEFIGEDDVYIKILDYNALTLFKNKEKIQIDV